ALPVHGLRGVRRARQRPGAGVPRQLPLPRGRPARGARDRQRAVRHPRIDADPGHVQLRLGARTLRRAPAERALADAAARARRAPPRDGDLSVAPSSAAPAHDYEPAGELKIGQVGIANLRLRTLDVARLAAEMADRVRRAPKLFARAAVIVDFGGLAATPDAAT